MTTQFTASHESITSHKLPVWFDDAKFGIFIHWGLYSVPAFAPIGPNPDPASPDMMRENRYAEWYENTMKFETSETAIYHRKKYGDVPYSSFQSDFETAAAMLPVDDWARIFKDSGARYVTLVTKHHDGYALWPSRHKNPHRANWQSTTDIVGKVADAVRANGMRFGAYYSGGLDWTFKPERIDNIMAMFSAIPHDESYDQYCFDHFIELIERYQPDYLWNDIGYPAEQSLWKLFAAFYNANPEGVVNDRWLTAREMLSGTPQEQQLRFMDTIHYLKQHRVPPPVHYDVITPEYAVKTSDFEKKWEATRGVGSSFAYNIQETEAHLMRADAIVHLLIDCVAKGGNLLINVGPRGDGSLCPMQAERLKDVGQWLRDNGEAIYGTRPWKISAAQTADGRQVRFTQHNDAVYAITLDESSAALVWQDEPELYGCTFERLNISAPSMASVYRLI